MLNNEKHQLIMGQILKDIYEDTSIAPLLGFKGGTCAYFFYNLPRFSVDLDFDLLETSQENQEVVYKKIIGILSKYGIIKDQWIKRYTVLVVLSYGDADHNIKVEINTRILVENIRKYYEIKEYIGISMLVAKKEYLFASKLAALTSRTETAMRDVYDIHFFAKQHWDIDAMVIQSRTEKTVKEYLGECVVFIEQIKDSQVLRGLGELLSEKEKRWVKKSLKTDTIFMVKNYISSLK
ncbi:hypothetical protein A2524_03420 [Candidatus Wolfebacteria bacterium RIFOXYD12_FULL_48_21]|nr:MAG: hypothetical protein A2524_03420 [Candidatus Wolfebacteria bacterium RIFOXYD12_FULL_48_21]OGM97253.1 MAG: hypothetical protein A2532_03220 [Candidatus Wolfebacteria bacterium RIFOXYD2_FULL_48_11]